jgi:hypothetical protein
MTYRTLSRATLVVGAVTTEIAIHAYAIAPKRPAKGSLTLDGATIEYRVTSGRGRGVLSKTYGYVAYKGENAFFEFSDAQVAEVGKPITLTSLATPTAAPAEPVAPTEPTTPDAPTTPEAEADAEAPTEPKAPRRSRKAKAEA